MKTLALFTCILSCLIIFHGCSNHVIVDPAPYDFSRMGDTLKQFKSVTVAFSGKHLFDTSIAGYIDEHRLTWSSDSGLWSDSLGKFHYAGEDGWARYGSSGSTNQGHSWTEFSIDPVKRIMESIHDSSGSYTWNNIPSETRMLRGIKASGIPLISINEDSAVFVTKGGGVAERIGHVTHYFYTYYRYYWNSTQSQYQATDWASAPEPELRIVLSRK